MPPSDPLYLTPREEHELYLNAQTTNAILRGISYDVLERIYSFDNAYGAWKQLEELYDKKVVPPSHPQIKGKSKVKDDEPHSLDEWRAIFPHAMSIINNFDADYPILRQQVDDLYGAIC